MSDQFEDRIFRACINDFYKTIARTPEAGLSEQYNLREFLEGGEVESTCEGPDTLVETGTRPHLCGDTQWRLPSRGT